MDVMCDRLWWATDYIFLRVTLIGFKLMHIGIVADEIGATAAAVP